MTNKNLLLVAVSSVLIVSLGLYGYFRNDATLVKPVYQNPNGTQDVFTYMDPLLDIQIATSAPIGYAGRDTYAKMSNQEIVAIAKIKCIGLELPSSADDVEVDRERSLATFNYVKDGVYVSFTLPYTSVEVRNACPSNIKLQLERI